MKALIIANGEIFQAAELRRRVKAEAFDLVVGADGGACNARTLDVSLHAVVGDLDSLEDAERRECKSAEFICYPAEKDETDLELALSYAKEHGAERVVIAGAAGGRLDSTIANILLLADRKFRSCDLEIWHGGQTAFIVGPPGRDIKGKAGDLVSLIPLGGDVGKVRTRGLHYPLREETLSFGAARGLSNIIDRQPAHVSLATGRLLLVHTPREDSRPGEPGQKKRTVNLAVQVLPLVEDVYSVVDRAIEVIQRSGFKYEVGPMETTLEGDDLDRLLETAKSAHYACFEAGAEKVVTIIKIADALQGTTIEEKVSKYRGARK